MTFDAAVAFAVCSDAVVAGGSASAVVGFLLLASMVAI